MENNKLKTAVTDEKERKGNALWFIVLNVLLFIYSFSGVFSKLASGEKFLSFGYCAFYGGVILLLGIYAIVWQQVLKHISLTTAFCNKGVTIVWGIVWGVLFFNEKVTWNMIVGAIIVIAGVVLVVKSDE